MKLRAGVLIWIVCGALWFTESALAYRTLGRRWLSSVTMHLQLGSSGSLIDGSSNWNTVAENALALWNPHMSAVSFRVIRDSTAGNSSGNSINNVVWGDDIYGEPFGSETLAVTLSWSRRSDNSYTESDVVFNRKFSWNSYRGGRRSGLVDLRRVALHEFGHVIGLDHPDEGGQSVTAIMNSRITDVDSLQSDDTNGARAIYGSSTSSNRSPSVTASCNPCRVFTGRTATISASGSDPDGDSLTYRWTASSGSIANASNSSTTYTAPATAGNVTVTVTASDGRGGSATSSVTIEVVPADRLAANERLTVGQTLVSPSRQYRLLYQPDGNLVLYDDVERRSVWATNSDGTSTGYLIMQLDGNLVLYDGQGRDRFASGSTGNPNARFVVQDDGNLVVYNASNRDVWSRF